MQGASPRDYRPLDRPRRFGARTIALVAGVVVIILLLAFGARAVISRAMCGSQPVIVNVAVSLDIAPAVQQVGNYFNNLNRNVSGHCAEVEVTEQSSQQVAARVSGQASGRGQLPVDAWVPESGLWVDLVRSSALGAAAVRETGVSVAQTPLVAVVPEQTSHDFNKAVGQASWSTLLHSVAGGKLQSAAMTFQMPDPTEDAAGLAAVVEAHKVFGSSADPRGEMTSLVHNVQGTSPFNNVTALADFAGLATSALKVKPVTFTSEQAAESYNRSAPNDPLDVIYPTQNGADYQLDYPFTITTTNQLKVRAAEEFSQVLSSSLEKSAVQRLGFRSADGTADPADPKYGIRATAPPALPAATPGEAQEALQQWKQLNLGSRDLVLVDTSQESQTLVGDQTAMQLLQKAASLGLGLFPDSTEMGAWEYADHLGGSVPYKVVVPMGSLTQQLGLINRRQQLQQLANTLKASAGSSAAMYSTILAGYRWMTANYAPGHVNALIILGSGTSNSPRDISLNQLTAQLRKAYNPQRPVEIIAVSAGSTANAAALNQIVSLTKGASFIVQKPSDIDKVFLDSVGLRICKPNCG
jgi:Bacterial extracellular solute-binding protein